MTTDHRGRAGAGTAGGAAPAGVIALRPVTDGDGSLLRAIYASSRADELALTGWSRSQQTAFLDLQQRAQAVDYTRRFPRAEHSIVLLDGAPVGRVWVNAGEAELRLLDITLLPRWRGRGVGTEVLRGLQQRAAMAGLPLRHTVLTGNLAARRLYRRLGFETVDATETHILMEWAADGSGPSSPRG